MAFNVRDIVLRIIMVSSLSQDTFGFVQMGADFRIEFIFASLSMEPVEFNVSHSCLVEGYFPFFFVAVQLQSLQNGGPTVPVIMVADSIVPLNATVKVVPLLPSASQPNTTLFPFTAPMTGHGGTGPTPEKVPLSFSPSCLKTKVILIGPSLPIY